MKKISVFIVLLSLVFGTIAQNGKITDDILKEIQSSYQNDAHDKAITNALSSKNIMDLTLSRENVGKTDHYFKYKVDVKGITDQKSSGRCWMFTSMNLLRPKVMEKYNLSNQI